MFQQDDFDIYAILYAEDKGREVLNLRWQKSTPVDQEIDVISHLCLNRLTQRCGDLKPSTKEKVQMSAAILEAFPGLRQLDDQGNSVNMFYNQITGGKFDCRLKYLRIRERRLSGIAAKRLSKDDESSTKKKKKWSNEQEASDQTILANAALLQKVSHQNMCFCVFFKFVLI